MIPDLSTIEHNLGKLQSGALHLPPYSEAFNCAAFVRYIAGMADEGMALSTQLSDCVERPIQYMRRGDIVFTNNFGHCGISLGYPYVVHYTKSGLQIELYIQTFAKGYAYGG